jgi:Bifunctional DNA primase/polymerase, N-terminal
MHQYNAKPDGEHDGTNLKGEAASKVESEMMAAALLYAQNDVPIFPVWNPTENGGCACPIGLDCPAPAKHSIEPLVPQGLRDATTDPDQIREWWTSYPGANIGMPTGKWSGVVVLEVDIEKGGLESLLALVRRHGVLPWTRVVHTEGGLLQLYFEHPGIHKRSSAGTMGPGLDFHGDGGSVLLPPSVHAKNKAYAWQGHWNGGREHASVERWT